MGISYLKKGRSISRVLSKGHHLSWDAVSRVLLQPTRGFPGACAQEASSLPLLGFAPNEVFRAPAVAGRAVGSYPAFSPSLPFSGCFATLENGGSLFSVALSVREYPRRGYSHPGY